jgi:DNA-binding transcriptional MocR family regulator
MTGAGVLSDLEQRMTTPTARGLAAAVSAAIGHGQLGAGDRLPPIRIVAKELGLSPTTVSSAWAMLQRAGIIATGGRSGTTIAPRRTGPTRYRAALTGDPDGAPARTAPPRFALDLSTGTPDRALLPSLVTVLRRIQPPDEASSYLDEPVLADLATLLRADWPFDAERITVVDGAMDALEQIITTHLRFGDTVAVEDPCFPPLLDLLEAVGAHPVPVALDEQGASVEDVRRAVDAGVRAVFLQPRGHNPTGITTTDARLADLAEIIGAAGILVIEDDSLGSIAASPDISLGTWLPDRTLHVRSYSKSHGPDLRLAALGGPTALVQPIVDRRFLGQGWTSRLLQRVLVHLLTDPASTAAVADAREQYAVRRAAIADRLTDRGIPVGGTDGVNIWVPVADETAALLLLASHGIGASSGSPFMVRRGQQPHIRITTGLVRGDFDRVADVIAQAAAIRDRPAR